MKKIFIYLLLTAMVVACARVPITGRKQVNLLPESQMLSMSYTSYDQFLDSSNVVSSSDSRAQNIKSIGNKIAASVEKYMKDNKLTDRIEGFEWEFNLVQDNMVNAWCMPGGKVVFYTGILPICETDEGIAVVMGHEIAHAIARHGNERMSQQLAIQAGGIALSVLMDEKPEQAQNLFLLSYGVGSQLGQLAFSRQHESEADKMGLIFMAMAGYDPREAVDFWQRMSEQSGGQQPPEFLSTHPSHDTRISDLQAFLPEALEYYNP
ncbi:M48 family metallopeptidase [Halocola ammonii]